MSKFTSFAIAGLGDIGTFIAVELVKQPGVRVVGLTRRGGSRKPVPEGVILREVDYDNEESLVSALQGVEVVISALAAPAGFEAQAALVRAAKKAGVELFAPSEYGDDTPHFDQGPFKMKKPVHEFMKSIGLPYVLFLTGGFADTIFMPQLGLDFANKKVIITGSGQEEFSFTSRVDIARYVAHVLTHLSPSSLEWSIHRIEAFHVGGKQIVEAYEKVKKTKLEVVYRDVAEVKKRVSVDTPDFSELFDWLIVLWAQGWPNINGLVGNPVTNHLFPEWNPESLDEVIEKYY
jgi:uncharacterized protein YbjT (DUF2867 family)